jgi:hypothetical protein
MRPMAKLQQASAERGRHDTIELLLGASAILLFGIALVASPKLGFFIGDVMDWAMSVIGF